MILSVSRRTDIPHYYSDWFFRRLKEGWLLVKNPMNPHQISRIELSPEMIDCIVFWTKNPLPMMEHLRELTDIPYYIQFTLTGYGSDMEPGIPDKKRSLIPVFRELSRQAGPQRVIWRYDPILFTHRYTPDYHLRAFAAIAAELQGSTKRCVISFLDLYAQIKKNMEQAGVYTLEADRLMSFAGALAGIARENGMEIVTCAEQADLSAAGIGHGSCIDGAWIETLTGYRIKSRKDKNQRAECGCIESVDVGTYDTCRGGCLYCYAGTGKRRHVDYDPDSPILCGHIGPEDRITMRRK